MKRLILHRIAISLYRFIASVAHLWLWAHVDTIRTYIYHLRRNICKECLTYFTPMSGPRGVKLCGTVLLYCDEIS
jgi:hypothetical protein